MLRPFKGRWILIGWLLQLWCGLFFFFSMFFFFLWYIFIYIVVWRYFFGNWSINRQWRLKELQASGVACVWPLFDSDWCPSAPHPCAPFTCSFTHPAPMFPSFLLFSMSASSTQHRCLSWHAAPYPLAFVFSRCQTLTACAVSVNIYPASFSSAAFADVCMCVSVHGASPARPISAHKGPLIPYSGPTFPGQHTGRCHASHVAFHSATGSRRGSYRRSLSTYKRS